MKFDRQKFTVRQLVENHRQGLIIPNPEYQRGQSWTSNQMRSLVDSLFRKYPLPALFLHEIQTLGLRGEISYRYHVVDGQQRIRALSRFQNNEFELLDVKDKQLKIPNSMRGHAAPWQGRRYNDLSPELRSHFDGYEIDAFVISHVDGEDEIRDLFIRLQAGKPLTAQQVRDAWPGPIGPYVEELAGKAGRTPKYPLFDRIDQRGSKDDESIDNHMTHRVVCAQMLLLFLERSRHPLNFCGIQSKHLDKLYHENTEFDSRSELAVSFEDVLKKTQRVLEIVEREHGKTKFRRLMVVSLFCLLHDWSRVKGFSLDERKLTKLATEWHNYKGDTLHGKQSQAGVEDVATQLRSRFQRLKDFRIDEDAEDTFSEQLKMTIRNRDNSICQICKTEVHDEEVEVEHFPQPHHVGGRTCVENGRLIHKTCHPLFGKVGRER